MTAQARWGVMCRGGAVAGAALLFVALTACLVPRRNDTQNREMFYTQPQSPEQASCMFVAPFLNLSNVTEAGQSVTHAMTAAVDGAEWFTALDANSLTHRLSKLDMDVQVLTFEVAQTVGRVIGAHAVIHGSVSGRWTGKGDNNDLLILDSRVVSTDENSILWAGSVLVQPDPQAQAEPLDVVLRTHADRLVARMTAALHPQRAVAASACFVQAVRSGSPEADGAPVIAATTTEPMTTPAPVPAPDAAIPSPDPALPPTPASAAAVPTAAVSPTPMPELPSTLTEEAKALLARLQEGRPVVLRDVVFKERTDLKPEVADAAVPVLGELLRIDLALRLQVRVHTDASGEAPTDRDSDRELTQRQAFVFLDYLASLWGVGAARLEAVGLGGEQPIMPNISKRGRMANRRVEVQQLK